MQKWDGINRRNKKIPPPEEGLDRRSPTKEEHGRICFN